ncbi:MAG: ABC-F family ATP-binding cassette domain-containing protein [Ardenticatenaceae bacterium]|nr:ABC-F family ATP-binding cassette domain-containing protein [Ardenticatenaceae bacterium]MCB9443284.1 ABC-F family ATP-binding cassette domain-containing protein [Ardenticatenaceae bacterium]
MAEVLVNLDKVSVSLAARPIFNELSWEIQDRQRIGLVGPNGAGKSTLLKLIAQELAADDGNIFRLSGLSWGRLEQEPALPPGKTVLAEALTAVPAIADIEAQMERLEHKMGQPEVYGDPNALEKVMIQHEKLLVRHEQMGGPRYLSLVKETLAQLGFGPDGWEGMTDHLSGGQKKLVMLAKLVVQQPRLLLLDEPDNHLDLPAKRNLEQLIHSYPGCVVIISHDRYLLDEVASHIAELENGRLTLYLGNYTAYANERQLRRLRQQQLYAAQQKEISKIEAAIKRFELWASLVVDERHIRQARSRQKMLDKMDKVEKVTEARRMDLQLSGWRGSKKSVELVDVVKRFGNGRTLFAGLNLTLWHGERVGFVGPNGAGKSYLLKQLLNPDKIDSGQIKIGPSSKIGYYAQEHETLNYEQTPLDFIRQSAPVSQEVAVAFLYKFLFTYQQVQQPIGKLSGGERSRLQLARLVLDKPNLLLLDEPTNNLDIPSIEVLEETLDEFVGTILVISHDRYFLDKVVDRVVELRNGRFTEFLGGYTDYLDGQGDLSS